MSWWTFSGDDLSGDAALDAAGEALEGAVAERAGRGEEKPALAEVALALEVALAARPGLTDPPGPFAISARGEPRAASAAPDLEQAMGRAVEGIATAFRRDHRRAPRVREICHAVQTVLGAGKGDLLRPPVPERVKLDVSEGAPP